MSVDLKAVAGRLRFESESGCRLSAVYADEAIAIAKLIEAAMERVKCGHDRMCDGWTVPDDRCTCGHDDLVAALEGK